MPQGARKGTPSVGGYISGAGPQSGLGVGGFGLTEGRAEWASCQRRGFSFSFWRNYLDPKIDHQKWSPKPWGGGVNG